MSDMTAPQTEQGVPLLQDGIDGEASAGGFQVRLNATNRVPVGLYIFFGVCDLILWRILSDFATDGLSKPWWGIVEVEVCIAYRGHRHCSLVFDWNHRIGCRSSTREATQYWHGGLDRGNWLENDRLPLFSR
jgi:hypothetical protein